MISMLEELNWFRLTTSAIGVKMDESVSDEKSSFKGILWPIFCIDINTHSDRK